MRRRSVKHAKERIEQAEGLMVLDPASHKGHWHELFENNNPIYLEIGMGKGKFINEHARLNPNINYIGLEKGTNIVYKALANFGEETPVNLRYICLDAELLKEIFETNEVNKIYLNFSDPWPKTRHEKRRLTNPAFLNNMFDILDGDIEFKTDNRGLFDFALEEIEPGGFVAAAVTRDLHNDEKMNEGNIMTEYEEKFSGIGTPINKMIISR